MIIDGKDSVLGRVATYAAKAALEGEKVVLVNANDLVIIGEKNNVVAKYRTKLEIGTTSKGPFFPRDVKGIVKRAIRGMLKRKSPHGRDAFRRITVFAELPEEYKDKEKLNFAHVRLDKPIHMVKIAELSNILKYRQS
ncbi:MAG: 50S ribosomal protein L13 [Candidatus Parvarchaeota archaeon]|jgi:large subunit ribosomal protein L13|nr:50S ribosomal protein L13 [Candidatus Parvarchaeota archaeon]MCL5101360.1 50S ribosomal protein L13 [Candidatus Parvarchaeota archaeon]